MTNWSRTRGTKIDPTRLSTSLQTRPTPSGTEWGVCFGGYTRRAASCRWTYDVGGRGWGNNELQYYTRDRLANARVENGHLIIEAHREPYEGRDYTSARLITRGKQNWNRGKIVVRAKLPAGRGTWPAIWMLGGNMSRIFSKVWLLATLTSLLKGRGADVDPSLGPFPASGKGNSLGTGGFMQ